MTTATMDFRRPWLRTLVRLGIPTTKPTPDPEPEIPRPRVIAPATLAEPEELNYIPLDAL